MQNCTWNPKFDHPTYAKPVYWIAFLLSPLYYTAHFMQLTKLFIFKNINFDLTN